MDFKIKQKGQGFRTIKMAKESSTVIEAGDFVAKDSNGYAIKGTASSAKLAWAPNGAASGDLTCEVTVGNDFTLTGTGDAAFAITQKGSEVDMVVTDSVQLIDVGESTTDVFVVGIANDSGVAGSTADIEVKINKPIF